MLFSRDGDVALANVHGFALNDFIKIAGQMGFDVVDV